MSVQLLRVPLSSPVARSIFRTSSRSLASSSFSPSFNHHQAPPPPPPSSSNRSRFRFRFLFAAAATAATAATVAHVLTDSIPTAYSAAVASPPPVNFDLVRLAICSILDSPDHDDGSLGPILVRLAWHSSGTFDAKDKSGGSNGARMRFAPESGWNANAGLDIARRALEPIKMKFPGLSYADLYTLAGVVAIQEMGGPTVRWRPGRSDFTDGSSSPPDGRLPDAHQGQSHLRAVFYRMGFNDREIVALTGAHCLGRCHAQNSGFEGPWTRSPTTFSNNFFTHLIQEVWTPRKSSKGEPQFENSKSGKDLMMLPADLALTSDPEFRKYVELYAKDEQQFFADFAEAFAKLLELGVTFPEQNKKNSSWWPFGSSSK